MMAWRRIALVGAMFIGTAEAAEAQTINARAPVKPGKHQERIEASALPVVVRASVAPDGRVVPGDQSEAGPIQRVGAGSVAQIRAAESPCAESAALGADEARRLVEATAREEGFQPELVIAVAKTESSFLSTSLSPKGAYGLMQLMPKTAQAYGVNICDPKDNVRGGVAFLRELTAKYKNPVYVLAAYNAGEPAILKAKGVPPITETVGYIAAILNDLYQWPAADRDAFGAPLSRARVEQGEDPARAVQRAGRPTRQAAARGEAPGWQGGFVQNFD